MGDNVTKLRKKLHPFNTVFFFCCCCFYLNKNIMKSPSGSKLKYILHNKKKKKAHKHLLYLITNAGNCV